MTTKTKTTVETPNELPGSSEEIVSKFGNKSRAIRALHTEPYNKSRGEIAKLLDIRYQHVRNVLIVPLKG